TARQRVEDVLGRRRVQSLLGLLARQAPEGVDIVAQRAGEHLGRGVAHEDVVTHLVELEALQVDAADADPPRLASAGIVAARLRLAGPGPGRSLPLGGSALEVLG